MPSVCECVSVYECTNNTAHTHTHKPIHAFFGPDELCRGKNPTGPGHTFVQTCSILIISTLDSRIVSQALVLCRFFAYIVDVVSSDALFDLLRFFVIMNRASSLVDRVATMDTTTRLYERQNQLQYNSTTITNDYGIIISRMDRALYMAKETQMRKIGRLQHVQSEGDRNL